MSTSSRTRIIRGLLSSSFGTALSRVLGAARDIAITNRFGAGSVSDAFWVAFTIPSVFRRFVADEGLTGALIPALAREESERGRAGGLALSDVAFTALLLLCGLLCAAGIALAPALVLLFGWGFADNAEQYALAVSLTRWMFPFVALVALVSFCEGVLNFRGHFLVPKLAPGLVSGTLVVAAVWGAELFSEPVWALPAGLLAGGVAHFLIHLPVMRRLWHVPRLTRRFDHPGFRSLVREMGKVALIGVCAQLNIMLLRSFASMLDPGAVTHYWIANRLMDLPQGIIGVGLGSALLPAITDDVVSGDWDAFRRNMVFGLRLATFMLLPAAAVMAAFPVPIVSVLFRHGSFTPADLVTTGKTFACMVPYFLGVAGIHLLKRGYFAIDERGVVLKVGFAGTAIVAACGYTMSSRYGVVGLALALSFATVCQLVAYVALLGPRIHGPLPLRTLGLAALRIAIACAPLVAVLLAATPLGRWQRGPADGLNIVVLVTALTVASAVYIGSAKALGVEELGWILRRFRRRRG
ncbi:MAG: murein biosynthesis integral membrane protein MurJ [Candidatus Schekmanbacteria bacterium]|nr:murein biosynthesis integral membrane protein MurJ [Candidatus Schekmanbacteria bacterium]